MVKLKKIATRERCHVCLFSASITLLMADANAPVLAADVDVDGGSSISAPIATGPGDRLRVGVGSTGTLTIPGGVVVNNNDAYVGYDPRSFGTVNVGTTGGSGTWTSAGTAYIGYRGTGVVNVDNGTMTANSAYLGFLAGPSPSDGTVNVSGPGASLTINNTLGIGDESAGTLNISNGGVVVSRYGWLGDDPGGHGVLAIDGAGSVWRTTNSGSLPSFNAGADGAGTVRVTNGGRLESVRSWNAITSSSSADITISGTGSEWSLSSYLLLGGNGSAKLLVEDGGKVTTGGFGSIGYDLSSSRPGSDKPVHGQVTVTGTGSSWTSSSDIIVGDSTHGVLQILDGGVVNSAGGAIALNRFATAASNPSTNGDVLVSGANSQWNIGANGLGVGILERSNGSLTIADGGLVSSLGEVSVAQTASSEGRINIGAAVGGAAAAPGILSAPSIKFYAGDGGLVFNHTGSNYVFDATLNGGTNNAVGSNTGLVGNGAIEAIAGRTIFNADHGDFTGTLEARGSGILQINGAMSGAAALVMAGGRLEGSGAVGSVINQGTIAPGMTNAIGTLTIGSDLVLGSTSILDFGLGSPTGTAGLDSDLINVGGNLTLDGTLNVVDTSGFGAGLYRLINYNGALTNNGLGIGLTPAGFAATDLTVQTSVANQVNLLVDTPLAPTSGFMWDGSNTTANGSADGGTGNWTATGTNWTIADGSANGIFDPSALLIFAGAPGTVTVDDGAGAIAIQNGMQFAANGYTLGGDAVGLDGATVVRVGDGTATGAGFTATIASTLTGAGSLEKTDLGTLVLTGANTYAGDTTISSGRLFVNGSVLGGGDTFVSSGAMLGGVGRLAGTTFVNPGGTIAPGSTNAIGTLTVDNVQFDAGSIFQVKMNDGGNVAGVNNDHVNARGIATINGGTIHVTPQNGTDGGTTYTPNTTYTILTSAGSRIGRFASVTDDYAFLKFADSYDSNNVYLTSSLVGGGTGTCPVSWTFNQNATCGGLLSIGSGGLYTAVVNLSKGEAPIALDRLSGEVHASAKAALIEDSRFPREAALDRLRNSLGAITSNNGGMAEKRINDAFAFWGQGFGSWGNWDSNGNAARLDRSTGGFFLGGDAEVWDNVRLGLFGGYGNSRFTVNDRDSTGSADAWHLGAYGGTQIGNLGLRFGGAYAWHNIGIARSVAFTGFADSLSSTYRAHSGQVFGEAGYRIDYGGGATFEPFANIAYVNASTNRYSEAGGEAALTATSQSMATTFTTIGLRAETQVMLSETTARLSGAAGWRHAFGDVTPLATYAFAGGDSFIVAGVPVVKDAFVLDLGASVRLAQNATLGVSYNGQFGNGFTSQGLKANFAVQF